MKYEDHPIAAIFPLLPETELLELAEDVKKNGLKTDIVIYEGKILDGRNRYRACAIAKVQPFTTQYAGDDPVGLVLSLNLHRRHLTAGQKAAVGTEALPHLEAEAKKRQGARTDIKEIIPESSEHGQARDKAAELVGVNPRYISDAKKIKEEHPEHFEKLKSGEMSIPAIKKLFADNPEPAPEPKAPFIPPDAKPSDAMVIAKQAVVTLAGIPLDDPFFADAIKFVKAWCKHREAQIKTTSK